MPPASFTLIAVDAPQPAPQGQPAGAPPNSFMMPLMILALVAMFVIMPMSARRQRREQQKMIDSLKPGARVVTLAGIVGRVVSVDVDELVVKSDDAKFRILRSAVSQVRADTADAAK